MAQLLARSIGTVQRFATAALEVAVKQGLWLNKPVEIPVLGAQNQGALTTERKTVLVSYEPPVLRTNDLYFWLNAADGHIYAADMEAQEWALVNGEREVSVLFVEGGIPTVGGSNISGGTGTASLTFDVLADLRAYDTKKVKDKTVAYVEGERTLYGYDTSANAIADAVGEIAPDSHIGRWLILSNAAAASGITDLDGGIYR